MAPVGKGRYLCGCDPDIKFMQYKTTRTDSQGFDVCPEHGDRMYGWASEYSERHLNSGLPNLTFSGKDQRDNRDPLMVYVMLKASEEDEADDSNSGLASTNGHTSET